MNKRTGRAAKSRKREEKPTRIPIANQDRLGAPQREGYIRRWVNDTHDGQRVLMFERAGYTKVLQPNMKTSDVSIQESQPGTPDWQLTYLNTADIIRRLRLSSGKKPFPDDLDQQLKVEQVAPACNEDLLYNRSKAGSNHECTKQQGARYRLPTDPG